MTNIKITPSGDKLIMLHAPFHPDLLKAAHNLGGEFDDKDETWTFDARDGGRLRAVLVSIFGTDGSRPVELTTARVKIKPIDGKAVWRLGRQIAIRWGRADRVRLGDGVIVIEGDFPAWAGSAKHPKLLQPKGEVTVEVRDVPKNLAEREAAENPKIVSIVVAEESEPAKIRVLTIALTQGQAGILGVLRKRFPNLKDDDIIAAALSAHEIRTRHSDAMAFPVS